MNYREMVDKIRYIVLDNSDEETNTESFYSKMKQISLVSLMPVVRNCFDGHAKSKFQMEYDLDTEKVKILITLEEKK